MSLLYISNMKTRKSVSIMISLFMFLQLLAGICSASGIYGFCVQSGIAGYYSSFSSKAFEMVNMVFDMSGMQTAKKEVPADTQKKADQSQTAILPDTQYKKIVKNSIIFQGDVLTYFNKEIYMPAVYSKTAAQSFIWMILLISMLLFAIRKKDGYVSLTHNNIVVLKHPVYI